MLIGCQSDLFVRGRAFKTNYPACEIIGANNPYQGRHARRRELCPSFTPVLRLIEQSLICSCVTHFVTCERERKKFGWIVYSEFGPTLPSIFGSMNSPV